MMYLFAVFFIDILAGVELDIYTPSFPQLQSFFGINTFLVELTLGINFIAHCFTALIVGNLSDKYGRRSIILYGLIVFIIGSALCTYTNEYIVLLMGRLLQGIGISAPSVLAYVLIVDKYPKRQAQHLTGINNAIITVAMALAPVAGSYVNSFFGWRANFLVLLVMGFISLALAYYFIHDEHHKTKDSLPFEGFFPILKSLKPMLYLSSISFACQAYWIFIGMSPILYMNALKVDILSFGFYQGVIAAGFSIVSLMSNRLTQWFGVVKCMRISILLILVFFLLVLFLVIFDIRNPKIITGIMLLQAISMAYPLNILWPVAVTSVPGANARMGALLVNFRFLVTAISIQIVSYFYHGSFVSIGVAILVTLFIALACGYVLHKKYNLIADI